MKGEREKILSMVEEGSITAEEAQDLLAAVEESAADDWVDEPVPDPPDMDYYREHWQQPFGFALVTTAIGGSLLLRTKNARGIARLFRGLILWPVTIIGGLVAIITYLSQDAPWLHVRVRPEEGPNINISLPLPLNLARKGIDLARPYAPSPEVEEQLGAAAEFLDAVKVEGFKDPMSIDVAEDGTQVQIFIG